MIDEIARNREELRALCRRFHVRRLDLFGSAARGDFDPERSDIDLLVEFDREHPDALSFDTYFGFKEAHRMASAMPVSEAIVMGRQLNALLMSSGRITAARDKLKRPGDQS